MTHPTISPHDPNVVLVGCDMTGGYITYDGGESWRMFNLGTVVSSFAFDPAHPDVIYASNPALWRSADRGRTWRMVFPDPHRNTREIDGRRSLRLRHADGGSAVPAAQRSRPGGVRRRGAGWNGGDCGQRAWCVQGIETERGRPRVLRRRTALAQAARPAGGASARDGSGARPAI